MKDFPKGLNYPHLIMTLSYQSGLKSSRPQHFINHSHMSNSTSWVSDEIRARELPVKTTWEPQGSDGVVVSYQCLVGSTAAISGASSPPWWWDLIGQMWPAALGEWNWLNPNKLCYSFDPPCTLLSLPACFTSGLNSPAADKCWHERSGSTSTTTEHQY